MRKLHIRSSPSPTQYLNFFLTSASTWTALRVASFLRLVSQNPQNAEEIYILRHICDNDSYQITVNSKTVGCCGSRISLARSLAVLCRRCLVFVWVLDVANNLSTLSPIKTSVNLWLTVRLCSATPTLNISSNVKST